MRDATVLVTANSVVVPSTRNLLSNNNIPIGISPNEITLTILFISLNNFESAVLMV